MVMSPTICNVESDSIVTRRAFPAMVRSPAIVCQEKKPKISKSKMDRSVENQRFFVFSEKNNKRDDDDENPLRIVDMFTSHDIT